jgi:alpha-L-fucosidase
VWEGKPEWGPEKAVDRDPETRWGAGVGTKRGWLEVDLGDEKRFDSVVIQEGWGRIQRFDIQFKEGDQWRTILDGKTIGPNFRREFDPMEARFVRLNILDAGDVPTIWEFQVFDRFEGPK